ncbi:MAG: cell division protein FtsZ [Candidatus Cloacimonadota bacterium]|nr:MAG: cell division protein FtsZ [Candidatus Cloacimonadota bacterium]PIE77525.1 MAG: cell division protein FtsZ [Candidatus Delongbacteria bacterium]
MNNPSITFDLDQKIEGSANLKIIGVGGGGCNAVDRMITSGLKGVEFIAVNTDAQALNRSLADIKIQIGREETKGLGAGGNPEVGRISVEEEECREKIVNILTGADMVFIAAGMGGGTGTGASPVIAKISREIGALTVAVVTKPFLFEGDKRMKNTEEGIKRLREYVDTLTIIPNQRLIQVVGNDTTFNSAFREADTILYNAARAITDLINYPGVINLDFADVKATMKGMGDALMGIGEGNGEDEYRCVQATQSAIQNTLLENIDIKGAKGVLVNFFGSEGITMFEINGAMEVINDRVGENAHVMFGLVLDPEMNDKVRVAVIAAGLASDEDRPVPTTTTSIKNFSFENSKEFNFSDSSITKREFEESNEFTLDFDENEIVSSRSKLDRFDDIDFEKPAFMRNNKD